MPGITKDGVDGNATSIRLMTPHAKKNLTATKSLIISTLKSPQSTLDLSMEGSVDSSGERLNARSLSVGSCQHLRFGSDNWDLSGDLESPYSISAEMKVAKTWKESVPSKKSRRPPLPPPEPDESTNSGTKTERSPENGNKTARTKSNNGRKDTSVAGLGNPNLGPFLLKQAKAVLSSEDDPPRALQIALRAAKSFERCADGKHTLDWVMCLHVIATIYSKLGQYDQAIPALRQSISIPDWKQGHDHALAMFSGCMQLGDIYAKLGQIATAIQFYSRGLEVQKLALGEKDPRVGETCRYLAEAYVQALQFDKAESLCQMALNIQRQNGDPASQEEMADRRLMGLICDAMGDHEAALEHLLVATTKIVSNGEEAESATVNCSMGDTYLSLARFEEALLAYQKALTIFKSTKGEKHASVASVLVSLADLYNKKGMLRQSKNYCENAMQIYTEPLPGSPSEDIASGLTAISALYESMNEPEQALELLQRALEIYNDAPTQLSTVAGVEAQIGVLYYTMGNYSQSYAFLQNAVAKFRECGMRKTAFFGLALNQIGLVCVHLNATSEAAEFFKEASIVLEQEYGPYHPETLGVYCNLAGTYDVMGRLNAAIEILEHVLKIREEKLGIADPDVHDEKNNLTVLLKEAGRPGHRKTKSLQILLEEYRQSIKKGALAV